MRGQNSRKASFLSSRVGFYLVITTMLSITALVTIIAGQRARVEVLPILAQPSSISDNLSPETFIVLNVSSDVSAGYDLASSEEGSSFKAAEGIGPLPASPSIFDDNVKLEEVQPEELEQKAAEKPQSVASQEEVILEEVKPSEDSLPAEEEEKRWIEYYVSPGDTLYDLGKRYSISPDLIAKANDLKNPDRLSEGQELLIPLSPDDVEATKEEVKARKEKDTKTEARKVEVTSYTVSEGDSLWSIANKFNLDINTLFGCNEMKNPNYLRVGMTLRIPNQDGIFYKVKDGDTLAKIASKYGTTVALIQQANGFEGANIAKGVEIFIPGAKPVVSVYSDAKSSVSSSRTLFTWPLRGRITSSFGWRRHPITKRRDFHTGIDIARPYGTIIRAAAAGRVVYAGWMGGYGRVVVIDHGKGYSTLYAHCSRLLVRKGQRVSSGQAIGKVGASGRATGSHLHFEVRYKNKPINPMKVLR